MDDRIKNAVEGYQCPGCVGGSDISCYKKSEQNDLSCSKHCAGTTLLPFVGRIFLGMPKGFNRLGRVDDMKISIFEKPEDFEFNHLNVPVWKLLDKNGNTFVRGLSPRINNPFIHIYLGDYMKDIDCIDIEPYLKDMD